MVNAKSEEAGRTEELENQLLFQSGSSRETKPATYIFLFFLFFPETYFKELAQVMCNVEAGKSESIGQADWLAGNSNRS